MTYTLHFGQCTLTGLRVLDRLATCCVMVPGVRDDKIDDITGPIADTGEEIAHAGLLTSSGGLQLKKKYDTFRIIPSRSTPLSRGRLRY